MTNEQLGLVISKRASDQFARDMCRLGYIMAQNYGKLSVADMQKILVAEEGKKDSLIKKIFRRSSVEPVSDFSDDRYYLLQLAFKCMDVLSVSELTLADLDAKKLRSIYMKHFKREYEEYEKYQYKTRDMVFRERALQGMYRADKLPLVGEDEMI